MRMLNDNNEKFLKMQETLIKITKDEQKLPEYVRKYVRIALEVEKSYYEELIKRIKAYNKSLPFDEEYKILESFEEDYEELELFQNKILNISEGYVSIELSDLSVIDINTIRQRKNNINGLLLNKNKIEKLEKESTELNQDLFTQNKKYSQNKNIIDGLETNLIEKFLNSEGRKIVNTNEEIIPSSFLEEYKRNDIDLIQIKENQELLKQKLLTAEAIYDEKKATKEAAETCNLIMPTAENRNILDDINKEYILANYVLCLLRIAKLIFNKVDKCNEAKTKRKDLIDLVEYRKKYLKEMKVRYLVDHIDGLKLEDDLIKLEKIEDNTRNAIRINKKLKEIEKSITECHELNSEYLRLLNEDFSLVINEKYIPIESDKEPEVADNKVIDIKDYLDTFNTKRAKEKTNNVINRVYHMMMPSSEEKIEEKNPELSINPVINEDSVVKEEELSFDTKKFPKLEEEQTFEESKKKEEVTDDIFQTVAPFENISLFDDKKEEEILIKPPVEPTPIKEEELSTEMPDIFWNIPEEVTEGKNSKENFNVEMSNLGFLEKNKVKKRAA